MIRISHLVPSLGTFQSVRALSHAISFETVSHLSNQWNRVETSFKSKGYALLQGPDSKVDTLEKVASLFGTAQKHFLIKIPLDMQHIEHANRGKPK